MITRFAKYSYLYPTLANSGNIKRTYNSLSFGYPCESSSQCTPVSLTLKPGTYKMECWGAKGAIWIDPSGSSIPGLGAYTSGEIVLHKTTQLYIYIGVTGPFNSLKTNEKINLGWYGGGATDVRLASSYNWYDDGSLISRIMVAAGGGGAEWGNARGGNGGELIGEPGFYRDVECKGATQISGGEKCQRIENYDSYPGIFGSAGYPPSSNDYGGFGGGGYYGGTSYDMAYAGSGGSSFISGHKGCDAVKNISNQIIHSGYNIHYSNLVFFNTQMIAGNKTIPLPTGGEGIWDSSKGVFRITMFNFIGACTTSRHHFNCFIFAVIFIMNS